MKHVKFILGKELGSVQESIIDYNKRIGGLKEDMEKLTAVMEKLLREEIELLKALEVLDNE